jgi:hypothetical protein
MRVHPLWILLATILLVLTSFMLFLLYAPSIDVSNPRGESHHLIATLMSRLAKLEERHEEDNQAHHAVVRALEEAKTKQMDMQSQLDILRQQLPHPHPWSLREAGETLTGQQADIRKGPEIGYTKWGRNFYNTMRDGGQLGEQESCGYSFAGYLLFGDGRSSNAASFGTGDGG